MDLSHCDLIRPLKAAEHHFLEVLVTRFSMQRRAGGVGLSITLRADMPAIWLREAKDALRRAIPEFRRKAARYQKALDSFLLEGEGKAYEFNDPDFPFRYVSGGTLPILRLGGKDYYSLFYRDVFPIGWNIANGGSDNVNELLNPFDTIERELREELIVLDRGGKRRYVFSGHAGRPFDRPEFLVARRFWESRFTNFQPSSLKEEKIPVKWFEGPDCLTVKVAHGPSTTVSGCFLNVNADDFGIEIDNIGHIHLTEDAILADGEMLDGKLLSRVIGLFEVDRLNAALENEADELVPDRIFYDAVDEKGEELEGIVARYIRSIEPFRSRTVRTHWSKARRKYDLCPVTRRIIRRYMALERSPVEVETGPFQAFISYGGEDVELAEKAHAYLEKRGVRTFCARSRYMHPMFVKTVNDALDSARCLVGVATRPENLRRPWPEFEWMVFQQDMLSGSGKTIVSLIGDFHPALLPPPFRISLSVPYNSQKPASSLRSVADIVRRA